MAAKPFFTPQQLKVFETLPTDERTSKIHDTFVPIASSAETNSPHRKEELIQTLKAHVFRAWPQSEPKPRKIAETKIADTAEFETIKPHYNSKETPPVVCYNRWKEEPPQKTPHTISLTISTTTNLLSSMRDSALFIPRGFGPDCTAPSNKKEEI